MLPILARADARSWDAEAKALGLGAPHAESADARLWSNLQISGVGSRFFLGIGNASPPGLVPVYEFHIVQANGDGWRSQFSTQASEPGWLFDDLASYAPST